MAGRTSDQPHADWLTKDLTTSILVTVLVLAAAFALTYWSKRSKRDRSDD